VRRAWDLIRVARHDTAVRSALVLAAAVVAAGCSGTSSVVGPSREPAACTFVVAPAAQAVGSLPASGSIAVTATSGCRWNATTDVGWITLTPPTGGIGNGMVSFTVSVNTSIDASDRTGNVIIAGERATITQGASGSSCALTVDPSSQTIGAAGGAGTPIGVSTNGCRWTATSNAPWIAVMAGGTGFGNGIVAFSVEANTGAERIGTLTIAGRTATITQTAADAPPPPPPSPSACPSTISPAENGIDGFGGPGHQVAVTTPSTCAWTATSNEAWITITNGASGTGNGIVTYTVALNTGAARRGTLTIAGRTATVLQGAIRFGGASTDTSTRR